MKRKAPKIFFYISCLAVCVFISRSCWVRLHAIDEYIAQSDAILSNSIRQEISDRLKTVGAENPDMVISALLQEFPCIASTSLHIQPNKKALIEIVAQTPLVRVNNGLVLTKSARILPTHHFELHAVQSLASIAVAKLALDDKQELSAMANELKEIDQALLKEFELTWNSRYEVVLRNPAHQSLQMICCAYQLADRKKVNQYASTAQDLLRDRMAEASKKRWVADVRFENQIIVKGCKGGNHHGTYVS